MSAWYDGGDGRFAGKPPVTAVRHGRAVMDTETMEQRVNDLDRRVGHVEQILPTLATKADLEAMRADLEAAIAGAIADATEPLATRTELHAAIADAIEPLATRAELHAAIADAVEPLATRAELHAAIADAIEPLATRAELRAAIAESEERTRTHFDVVGESLRDDIRLIAEGLAALTQRLA
ncbi:MAG: hypothetical protein OXF93_08835 [Acidobacteria bacterium]|nr:hypothetical protein [Acidobacteriota bacterium]